MLIFMGSVLFSFCFNKSIQYSRLLLNKIFVLLFQVFFLSFLYIIV